jgi:CheY-like chemotaxis protein
MNNLKSILLAEDNPNDVELTLEALAENKIANPIVVVKDGVEALAYLRREGIYEQFEKGNPCMVLLDIKMPRMDGIETLRAIRTDEKLKSIPTVILTSSREDKDIVNAYGLGVNAYVIKPVVFQKFVEAVKQIGSFWAVLNELPPEKLE